MHKESPAIERRLGFLSAIGLKLIALAAMTIDHIAVYCFQFELVLQFREQLRLVGRIAAPLFLFCVVESVRHTKSRKKYLLRLYIAAVVTGTANLLAGELLHCGFGGILHSLVWAVVFILLTDGAVEKFRSREYGKALLNIVILLGIVALTDVLAALPKLSEPPLSAVRYVLFSTLTGTEYSLVFVLTGVLMYFAPGKVAQGAIIALLGFASLFASPGWPPALEFIGAGQWTIMFAAPFIWLYNGQRGANLKYFFYLYYPLHQYALAAIAALSR